MNKWIIVTGVVIAVAIAAVMGYTYLVKSGAGTRRLMPAGGQPAPKGYTNTMTATFPDGFDPVTFMPPTIVVHRDVTYK